MKKIILSNLGKKILCPSIAAAILILSMAPLFPKDSVQSSVKNNLKAVKEEAKAFGKEENGRAKATLESLFSGEKLSIHSDELLPEEDRGKVFDHALAAEMTDTQQLPLCDVELQEIIDSAHAVEDIEGSEAFLIASKSIIENPHKSIGVASISETLVPEEKNIETCQEGGSYIKTIEKKRNVVVTPRIVEEVRTCLGHKKEKEFFWKGDAEKQVKDWKQELSVDGSLMTWSAYIASGGIIKNYHAVKKWTHKQGTVCDKNHTDTKILQEEKETDHWSTDPIQKQLLKDLEASIDCELMQTQAFNPGSRTISGKSIYRDSWNQRLIFSCKPGPNSKCKKLQEQGGVLLKRTCLEDDDFGDCLSWEKIYDMGGKASYVEQRDSFENKENLFDLEDYDPSYEKNREFGQAISSLASLENLGESTCNQGFDPNSESIFAGKDLKCRRSFDSKNLFDCCHRRDCKGRGVFIGLDLGKCSKEEKNLFEKVQEGKCHRIGHIENLLMTEHVYCCFPTKLARIIQEEGHKQLGISWGKAEKPKCRGLTLRELQSLDFEQMDFTDFIEDLQDKADSQRLAAKLQSMAQDFSNSLSESEVQSKTEEKTDLSKEKVLSAGGGV